MCLSAEVTHSKGSFSLGTGQQTTRDLLLEKRKQEHPREHASGHAALKPSVVHACEGADLPDDGGIDDMIPVLVLAAPQIATHS